MLGKWMQCNSSFVNTQTNRSWIYTCAALCINCYAREVGKATETRAAGPTVPPPAAAPLSPVPEIDARNENLLLLLSKTDWLPHLQAIQRIPRNLDRKYAAVRLQTHDRGMQAAKANTAAPTQRLWSKMALLIPHLILPVAPGHKQQERPVSGSRPPVWRNRLDHKR